MFRVVYDLVVVIVCQVKEIHFKTAACMGSRRGEGRGVANEVSYEGGGVGIARRFNSLPFLNRSTFTEMVSLSHT